MSRSGYSDDGDQWDLIRWRGAVKAAIRGKRGQQTLREIAAALDALPQKELAAESLVTADGEYCTLGALGRARGIDMTPIDPEDRESVAQTFGIAGALAAEIMYLNDEAVDSWRHVEVEIVGPIRYPHQRTQWTRIPVSNVAAKRWRYMRDWVAKMLTPDPTQPPQNAGGQTGERGGE